MSMPRRDDFFVFLGSWVPGLWLALGLSACSGDANQPTMQYSPGASTQHDVQAALDAAIEPVDADPALGDADPAVTDVAATDPDLPYALHDEAAPPDVATPQGQDTPAQGTDATPVPDVVADEPAAPPPDVAIDIVPELPIPPPGGHAVCDPCGSSSVCKDLGAGAACVSTGKPSGATGSFCAIACAPQGCPSGYACAPSAAIEGTSGSWCLPTSAPCTCSAAAIAAKWTTSCFKPLFDADGGVLGQCTGVWSCDATGDPCSAAVPTAEVCDGKDNDCDGLTDEAESAAPLCDDGNACTTGDACVGGKCVPGQDTCGCKDDTVCQGGANACLGTAFCDKGQKPAVCGYKPGTAVVCPAAAAPLCAAMACDPASGTCKATPKNEDGPCDADGSACTAQDHCHLGVCLAGGKLDCDDKNACTDDSCDAKTGCVHTPNALPCDADGSACTTNDQCQGGTCKPGKLTVCTGSLCMAQACNPASGQCEDSQKAANGTLCAASTPCAGASACKDGICTPGAPPDCGDGNPCTDDACDPDIGCTHLPNNAPCNDANPCTAGDVCSAGACKPGAMICECQVDADCAPKNPSNLCDGTLVCDAAKGHVCVIKPETVVKCAPVGDGICENAACEPTTGACFTQIAAKGTACSDGNACTAGDGCNAGLCQPGAIVTCDDKDPCTTDACDPVSGNCSHVMIPGCGVTFQMRYGGAGAENLYSVKQTKDGGYIGVGSTTSFGSGGMDLMLVRTDGCGNPLWAKAIGGAKDEEGWWVEQTKDGGFISVGSSKSTTPGSLVVRSDANGNTIWSGTYGGGGFDYGRYIKEISDGGFVFLAEQYTYTYNVNKMHAGTIMKLDKDGNVVWVHSYGGTLQGDTFFKFIELTDGGFMLTGGEESMGFSIGDDDYWFMRLDSGGNQLWSLTIGADSDDEPYDMIQTSDGGFLMAGKTTGWNAIYHSDDAALLKVDANGKVQWMKRWGGFDEDRARKVFEVADGYIVTGFTSSFGASKDMGPWPEDTTPNPYVQYDGFMAKVDKQGTLLWMRLYGNDYTQYGYSSDQTADGGFILSGLEFGLGSKSAQGWLVKTDASGMVGCDVKDLPLASIDQATCAPKSKLIYPLDFGGGFKLNSAMITTDIPVAGFASAICPCK